MQRLLLSVLCLVGSCCGQRIQTPERGTSQQSFAQADAQTNSEAVPLKTLAALLASSNPDSAFQSAGALGSLSRTRGGAPDMFFGKKSAPAKKANVAKKAAPARGRAAKVAKKAAPVRSRPAPVAKKAPAATVSYQAAVETPGVEGLKILAKQLNPLGYWDPLNLGSSELLYTDGPPKNKAYKQVASNEATVGFLRHAEIKHGRVAMAAFVGYLVQSNGIHFPWNLNSDVSFADIAAAGSPPEQWDALPTSAKVQILLFIGFLESFSETPEVLARDGNAHYMKGGTPGKFPSFAANTNAGALPGFYPGGGIIPHPVPLDLFDPLKLNSKRSREALDKSLLAEINNGRLAMLGIFAFLAEQKVPGAVPALKGLVAPYSGEIMAPFSESDAGNLPFVDTMLNNNPVQGILNAAGK